MSNEEIIGIINHINSLSFSEFEIETNDLKLRIARAGVAVPINTITPIQQTVSTSKPDAPADDKPTVVSPISGIYYQASAPGATPYVQVGSNVSKGDILCIIEAMKMMIEVKAECDGVVKEITSIDGEAVEEGNTLFVLEGE